MDFIFLPLGVTDFARDPVRSHFDEYQKNDCFFLK